MIGVYKITNNLNQHAYIGISTNITKGEHIINHQAIEKEKVQKLYIKRL